MMNKIITAMLLSYFLVVSSVYAGTDFQYSRPIQTDIAPGYKSVVLDKEVFIHSHRLQDLRVFNEADEEVPYFLDSIQDATTSQEKEGYILAEEAPFVTTQVQNDTVLTIEVNQLFAFRLELNTDDMFERNYALYGINGDTKWYLIEGTLANIPLDPSLPIKKEIEWADSNPINQLQLVIHNRDDKPLNLKSLRISYYLNKLVFKDLGNTHYRLAYGNDSTNSPHYDIMDYKTTIKKETLTPATLGSEVSITPKTQLPENPTKHKLLLFNLTISALALLLIIGIGLSLRKKNPS